IGILTVPANRAQAASELMIEGGIKAIWNFTPFRIKVPDEIIVQNTSIYAHLAVMFNRLQTSE
ncbi:MAG: redox-sensing transcriptional repressor Rex, partial [Paludibacteraceae bacterium]|nr:redox-sensing transcriptional repressor Rex [Paludibacteraceae bacterium]